MQQSNTELQPERYRGYLLILTRTQLHTAGLLRNKVSASDIVQEALLQAHKALPQFHGSTEAELKGWLRKILTNKLTDAARRFLGQKRNVELEKSFRQSMDDSSNGLERLAAGQTTPGQGLLRREREALLADALLAMPDDQAAAIQLHYLAGHSLDVVATELGRTKPSVAGLLRRGLKELRTRLKDLE